MVMSSEVALTLPAQRCTAAFKSSGNVLRILSWRSAYSHKDALLREAAAALFCKFN